MKIRRVVVGCLALALGLAGGTAAGAATGSGPVVAAQPAFQLPFPCGQAWNGNSSNSSAHRAGGSVGMAKYDSPLEHCG